MKQRGSVSASRALIKLVVFFIILLLIFIFSIFSGLYETLSAENIRTLAQSYGSWGVVVFVAAFMLILFLFIPPTLMTIAGGFFLGPFYGMLVSIICVNLGGFLLFWISRKMGRDGIRALAGDRLLDLDKRIKDRGILAIIVLRLIFTPFGLVCVSAGVSSIRLSDFVIGTLVGTFPTIACLSFLGHILLEFLDSGDVYLLLQPESIFFVVLYALALLFPYIWKRFKSQEIRQNRNNRDL